MHLPTLPLIIFCHMSLALPQLPYQSQAFKLPKHPSNWICTVHITTPTFSNYTSSDVIQRILTSNHEEIIPTLSTMSNRSISISPVNSFFEQCTISILVDATVNRSSYIFRKNGISLYIYKNKYVYRGWRHSIIIVIHFSCSPLIAEQSLYLPHRLFYHSIECGDKNIFPNRVFVPNPQLLVIIENPTHNIHDRKLPPHITRSLSAPKYSVDVDFENPNEKSEYCLNTRWNETPLGRCTVEEFALHHLQYFLNFTIVKYTGDNFQRFGAVLTYQHFIIEMDSILMHAIGSSSDRIVYCDRNSDSPRLRPIKLLSPFSFWTWIMLLFLLILSAVVINCAIFDPSSVPSHLTVVTFMKTIFNSLFDLIVLLLEQDLGRSNSIKICLGLIVIYLGNEYKNQLTIELVYPRAQDAIRNVTELLDLNFNIICGVTAPEHMNKLAILKSSNLYWEIDSQKRGKYVREVDRWLILTPNAAELFESKIENLTERNALVMSAPDHLQANHLQVISVSYYPLSCHFVSQPFPPTFKNLYFINPKAEQFKWLTAKFLDHGLFEFWKGLESHIFNVGVRRVDKRSEAKSDNTSSSTETLDFNNFIGQVHFPLFYTVVSILIGICIVNFLSECAIQNARELSLFALEKMKEFGMILAWPVVRCLYLVRSLHNIFSRIQSNS
jgi:hypothetical protein